MPLSLLALQACVYDLEGVVGKIFLHRFPIVQPGAVVSGGEGQDAPKRDLRGECNWGCLVLALPISSQLEQFAQRMAGVSSLFAEEGKIIRARCPGWDWCCAAGGGGKAAPAAMTEAMALQPPGDTAVVLEVGGPSATRAYSTPSCG